MTKRWREVTTPSSCDDETHVGKHLQGLWGKGDAWTMVDPIQNVLQLGGRSPACCEEVGWACAWVSPSRGVGFEPGCSPTPREHHTSKALASTFRGTQSTSHAEHLPGAIGRSTVLFYKIETCPRTWTPWTLYCAVSSSHCCRDPTN